MLSQPEDLQHLSVFRKDRKNVGDWWSRPNCYLPLRALKDVDLVSDVPVRNVPGTLIVGGGGLGRSAFAPYLDRLARPDRAYKLVAWGVGSDSVTERKRIMAGPTDMAALLAYFHGFDDVGTRIYSQTNYNDDPRFRWVPCASCLSPWFLSLLQRQPIRRIGIYEHLREPLTPHIGQGGRLRARLLGRHAISSNRGIDLEAKLTFLSECEYVLTNSYHGVYWGTLLGRKVICAPFKNGLFSFRHAPNYLDPNLPGATALEKSLDEAASHPTALDESRSANLAFYRDMLEKYGDI